MVRFVLGTASWKLRQGRLNEGSGTKAMVLPQLFVETKKSAWNWNFPQEVGCQLSSLRTEMTRNVHPLKTSIIPTPFSLKQSNHKLSTKQPSVFRWNNHRASTCGANGMSNTRMHLTNVVRWLFWWELRWNKVLSIFADSFCFVAKLTLASFCVRFKLPESLSNAYGKEKSIRTKSRTS